MRHSLFILSFTILICCPTVRGEETSSRNLSAMGMVGNQCVGTLVGPSFVLTSLKCVLDDRGKFQPDLEFYFAGYHSSIPNRPHRILGGWWDKNWQKGEIRDQWAILAVDGRPGDEFGFLETAVSPNDEVELYGYTSPIGKDSIYSMRSCVIRERNFNGWVHDCSLPIVSDGAPFFFRLSGARMIEAIQIGNRNQVAVPAHAFMAKVKALIKGFHDFALPIFRAFNER